MLAAKAEPGNEARKQPGVELVQEAGETVFAYVAFLLLNFPAELTVCFVPKVLVVSIALLRISPLASRLITTGATR
jgi:hypothetical protein